MTATAIRLAFCARPQSTVSATEASPAPAAIAAAQGAGPCPPANPVAAPRRVHHYLRDSPWR